MKPGIDLEHKFAEIRQSTEGWIARSINKPISFFITRQLLKTAVTPNQITVFNLAVAILAGSLFISGSHGIRIFGACLMQFSSILDGCDGEVAKIKGLSTALGAWLDTIADDLANNLFFMGLAIGIYLKEHKEIYWTGGLIGVAMSLVISVVIYHQLITTGRPARAQDFKPAWQTKAHPGRTIWFERFRPMMKRDFFIFVMFLAVLLDQRIVFFWMALGAITLTFVLYSISFIYLLKKQSVFTSH